MCMAYLDYEGKACFNHSQPKLVGNPTDPDIDVLRCLTNPMPYSAPRTLLSLSVVLLSTENFVTHGVPASGVGLRGGFKSENLRQHQAKCMF